MSASAEVIFMKRRGTVLIYTTMGMVAFAGFASLAIDVAHVHFAKLQLQVAADAAARAACQALPNGTVAAQNAAVAVAAANKVDGSPVNLNPSTDLTFGVWNPTTKAFTPLAGAAIANANAVRVAPVRSKAHGNAVSLSLASVVGIGTCDIAASGTACRGGNVGAYSLIGLNGIVMSGSGFTDSYNALQGPYSVASAHHKGSIASNGNISLQGSARVDGDARCGVGMTTTVQGTALVTGLNAPLGSVMTYPSATLPSSYQNLGDVSMSSGTVDIPGGTYYIGHLTLSGTSVINWTGPTVLYIGYSYNVSGGAQINTYRSLPANRILKFLPTCTTATWTGTNQNVGEMYAPDTDFTIGGTVDLYGRVVARTLNVNTDGGLHYDESLGPPGGVNAGAAVILVK
jgi:Flp pilus assembly protein TadG